MDNINRNQEKSVLQFNLSTHLDHIGMKIIWVKVYLFIYLIKFSKGFFFFPFYIHPNVETFFRKRPELDFSLTWISNVWNKLQVVFLFFFVLFFFKHESSVHVKKHNSLNESEVLNKSWMILDSSLFVFCFTSHVSFHTSSLPHSHVRLCVCVFVCVCHL